MATDVSVQRVVPQNIEAEQSVLGAILLENEALPRAIEILPNETLFYKPAHKKIYSAILSLFERNEPIDLITLSNDLKQKDQLEEVGGLDYLSALVESLPTAANIHSHSKIVKEKALLRRLISVGTETVNRAYEETEDVDSLLDRVEAQVFDIAQHKISQGFEGLKSVLKESFLTIEKLFERKEKVTGVPTGFVEFDQKTAGLQPGELIVIAGRPSMGKTALAINIAQYAGVQAELRVAIFSLEMSKEQLVLRMLCSEARVNAQNVRTGYLSKGDWPKLTTAAGVLNETEIFIDDSPALTVLEIRAKARRLMAEKGLNLIIVDYLQLIRSTAKYDSRVLEIGDITRSLKALAKELALPVVVLSQLSRAPEQRSDRRPQLSDLRESGSIEQDADMVVFVYREEFYNPSEENRNKAELIIGKQRNGPVGTVHLAFFSQYTRFDTLSLIEEEYMEVE
jgi:replicative DNA helicase